MTASGDDRWPAAELGTVARARVLSAAMPGTWLEERVVPVPFTDLWDYVSDLELAVPEFDADVRGLRITRRHGSHLRLRVATPWRFLRVPIWLDATLDEGWCLMRSLPQAYVIVMAAEPEGAGSTRLALVEGVAPTRLRRLLRPVLTVSRWRHRHHLPRDADNIVARLLDVPAG